MLRVGLRFLCCAVALANARAHAEHSTLNRATTVRSPEVRKQSTAEPLPSPREDVSSKEVVVEDVPLPIEARVDGWRYRYHLGRWWYMVEPGHWMWWDGSCWQDARPDLPKQLPDGRVQRVGLTRRFLSAWPQVPSFHEHHGWVGGFYSSGGGYGDSGFGYGYGVPNYGPSE